MQAPITSVCMCNSETKTRWLLLLDTDLNICDIQCKYQNWYTGSFMVKLKQDSYIPTDNLSVCDFQYKYRSVYKCKLKLIQDYLLWITNLNSDDNSTVVPVHWCNTAKIKLWLLQMILILKFVNFDNTSTSEFLLYK